MCSFNHCLSVILWFRVLIAIIALSLVVDVNVPKKSLNKLHLQLNCN